MDLVSKAYLFMASIAEWFVGGMTAAAKGEDGPASQAEGASFGVQDFEIALDTERTVVVDGNSCCRHKEISP